MVEKISNPQLTAQEEEWLNRILAVPTPIHPLLYSQINAATIEREFVSFLRSMNGKARKALRAKAAQTN